MVLPMRIFQMNQHLPKYISTAAQITSFVPKGFKPLIFLSPKSLYQSGKAIRGGVPISWPWFADHPTDATKPAHGFARTCVWEVRGTRQISANKTQITLGFGDNEKTRALWDYSFDLEIAICIGKELNAELVMTNTGNYEFTITSAFHSYYHVGDINDVKIHGLNNTSYIDKVDNFTTKIQKGPITIWDETDRIYIDSNSDCIIEDRNLAREIRISKYGSNSTVVWNPWSEKARQMNDLGDEDYTGFVCVETANAGDDLITISPNKNHKLSMNVSVSGI